METKSHSYQVAVAANQNIKERDYWLDKLAGADRKTFLYDFAKNKDVEPGVASLKFTIDGELYSKLTALSSNSDYSLHIVLTAVLTLLLGKYNHADDLMIGTPIYKQNMDIEFVNTVLVLRSRLTAGMSFKDLLLQVKQTVLEAAEHQNYPIYVLPERLNIPVTGDGNPFFDVALLVERIHNKKDIAESCYRMLFSFSRTGTRLEIDLEYDTCFYRRESVQRILRHFIYVLETVVANVTIDLADIDILTKEDKEQILGDFNQTAVDYPRGKTVCHLFEEQVEKTPGNVAAAGPGIVKGIENRRREMALTYLELDRAAGRLAALLIGKGVCADRIVAVMMMPSIEMILSLWAILKAGGAYLPIEPEYPAERIFYMLADSRAKLLLTCRSVFKEGDSAFAAEGGKFAGLDIEAVFVEDAVGNRSYRIHMSYSAVPEPTPALRATPPGEGIPQYRRENRSPVLLEGARAACYVIYTSGSTGKPKGVLVNHGNLMANLFAFYAEFDIRPTDNVVQLSYYTFDAFSEEFYPVLLRGGKLIIPGLGDYLNIEELGAAVLRHKVSMVDCSPLLLNELNKLDSLKSVRLFISGGDVLRESYIDRLSEAGDVYNTYGPTETTVCVSYYKYKKGDTANIPIGRPIANYNVFILDNSLRMMPVGVVGEICVSGPGVTRGYLNRPELTADMFTNQKFCSNFFNPAARGADKGFGLEVPSSGGVPEGRGGLAPTSNFQLSKFQLLYKTGDLGRWLADGCIEFHGRKDHQVKIRGFRIEIGEIESLLSKRKDIEEAAVTVREGRDGDKYLCAYIVPARRTVDESRLRRELSGTLPGYMIPAFFVQLEKMPLTSGGKIDRKALPEPEITSSKEYVEPRNKEERDLLKIWREILDIERIGIYDNFFEIGGHSLRATLLVSRIHKEFDVELPLTKVFMTPTIKDISDMIRAAAKTHHIPIEPGEKKEYYTSSSVQKRLFVMHRLDPGGTSYNMPEFFYLDDGMDKERMERIFRQLISCHESLRTSFAIVKDEPVQIIREPGEIEFKVTGIRDQGSGIRQKQENIPAGARRAVPGDLINRFIRPFDLSKAPLLRIGLAKGFAETGGDVLMMDIHHIINDAVSRRVLIDDFISLYEGETLIPPRIAYRDYARWQKKESVKAGIKEQAEYWRNEFCDEIPVLNLPYDFPRPVIRDFTGRNRSFVLPPEKRKALNELAQEKSVTLYMLILSLYIILLHKLSGREDIVVGSPTAGRGHIDVQRVIGMFVNTLALRSRPNPGKTFSEFLSEVKETTLRGFENQDYQFEELVEELSVVRDISRNPLFDVYFVLQDPGSNLTQHSFMTTVEYESHIARFDLSVAGMEVPEGLYFEMEYRTGLFKEETGERFIEYFKDIVSAVLENPGQKIADIDVIPGKEKSEILGRNIELSGRGDRGALPGFAEKSLKKYVEPSNNEEKKLRDMWRELLGIRQIGVYDNFFELGGQSVKATSLVDRIHKTFDVTIPLTEIFLKPTIKEVADSIRAADRDRKINPVPGGSRI